MIGLPTDGSRFIKKLRDELSAVLDKVDKNFPANDSIEFGEQGLIIHKPGKEPEPPNKTLIDQAITTAMQEVSILEALTVPGVAASVMAIARATSSTRASCIPRWSASAPRSATKHRDLVSRARIHFA